MASEAQYNADNLAAIEAAKQQQIADFQAEQAADAAWAEQQYQEYKTWMLAEMDA
jgi:hypothetical protein